MKGIITAAIFLNLILFIKIINAQNGWKLDKDSTNIAQIILDYQTYKLEMGYFSRYRPCDQCDNSALPFIINEVQPSDFGSIEFLYSETNDVIFAGGIVWAGSGQITFPEKFTPADSFQIKETNVLEPMSVEYFNRQHVVPDSLFKLQADQAWKSIQNLNFVEDISRNKYRVGIYLYTPSVGVFNPESAKWVIFLYQGQLTPTKVNEKYTTSDFVLSQNYPNPFNPVTTISFTVQAGGEHEVTIKVYDLLGNCINTLLNEKKSYGNYSINYDGGNLSSGIYFYTITAGSYKETKKMIILK